MRERERDVVHLQDMLQGLAILSRCHSFHSLSSIEKTPTGTQEHPLGMLLCLQIPKPALTS